MVISWFTSSQPKWSSSPHSIDVTIRPMSSTEQSKFISFVLRHRPEAAGLSIDSQGWVSVTALLSCPQLKGLDFEGLKAIVAEDEKGRYSISEDLTKIRANQGHSTPLVNLAFRKVTPPTLLWHGTTTTALPEIKKHGLLPMKRHHVHLTADPDTAFAVGGRRKSDVAIITIDVKKMVADGVTFYVSENGVYLTDHVHPKYFKEIK